MLSSPKSILILCQCTRNIVDSLRNDCRKYMVKTHQVVTTLGSGLASCLANVRFGILVYHSGSKTSDLGVQHPDLKAGGATVGAAVVVDPSNPQLSSITCFVLAISRSLNLVRIVNRTLRHIKLLVNKPQNLTFLCKNWIHLLTRFLEVPYQGGSSETLS